MDEIQAELLEIIDIKNDLIEKQKSVIKKLLHDNREKENLINELTKNHL